MSYRDRDRDRRDSGHGGSRYERSSRPSGSSRRSPSPSPPPRPRSDRELPEAFGRVPELTKDDDSNVLQRMKVKFSNAPLGSLTKCLDGGRKIKVWTRNFKEVRGICTGYIIAYDKHWNLVMTDVDEVYLKRRKHKTPCFEDMETAENFQELPPKVPRQKKAPKSDEAQETVVTIDDDAPAAEPVAENAPAAEPVAEKAPDAEGKEKKKKRRKKKKGSAPQRRHLKQIFIRGDSIVMAAILD